MSISTTAVRAYSCFSKVILSVAATWCMVSCQSDVEPVELHRLDRLIARGVMPDDSLSVKATETLFKISGYPGCRLLLRGR